MMKAMKFLSLLAALLLAVTAAAADLKSAKAEGLVGEQSNGYLGLVAGNAPADVQALVASVNEQRKAHFAQIAAKTGASLDEAAKIFAREAYARTEAGHYIQSDTGAWMKK
jgi:uncharacterized protein YdbL (DUF1318 family)